MSKNFWSDRRGNFAAMFTIAAFPMLAGIGMAMEYSNITSQRAKLQNAVDAAILFAGRYLDQNDVLPSQNDIEGFVDSNFEGPFTVAQFAQSGNSLVLSVDAEIPAFFFGDVYPDVFDQQVSASIPYGGKSYIEVAMVLDSTGSMSGDKIATLKTVANNFVDELAAVRDAKNDIKIGLVPFNKYVNIGDANKFEYWVEAVSNPAGWTPCVGSRDEPHTLEDGITYETVSGVTSAIQFPAVSYNSCPAPIVELTESTADLKNGIAAMNAKGSTYIGEGVAWGRRVLSKAEPFTKGKNFGSLGANVRHEKILMVLTDGDNVSGPSFPQHNANGSVGNDYTEQACDQARAAGITIYSIVFGTNVSNTGKAVMVDCAGGASGYFEAANSVALQAVFDEILAKLVALRLSS